MTDTTKPTDALPAVMLLGALAGVAFLMDAHDPAGAPSTSLTAPAEATVTAPITNTITISNPAPMAAPAAANGVIGTAPLAMVLGTILAVGLIAVIGGVAAAFLYGSQGGRRGIGRSGEYNYAPTAHEPGRWSR